MEVAEQYSKRARLNSWESTVSSFPGQQQQAYYSPNTAYPGSGMSMEGWGGESKPRSLSTSTGMSSKPGQAFSSYGLDSPPNSLSSSGHRLSMGAGTISPSLSSDTHPFSGFQEHSDLDPSTTNSTPSSLQGRQQQLKPIQTQSSAFDATTSAGFFHPHYSHRPSMASSNEHRGSISMNGGGVEMSPTSSNAGYMGSGFQSHQLAAAAPIMPSQGGPGIILGGTQAVNVVTTYPPRRKAIRAAQVHTSSLPIKSHDSG